MSEPMTLDTLIAQVRTGLETAPVLDRLARAVEVSAHVSELGENLVGFYVDEARRDGVSWADIGTRLGVSRQAVQKRFIPSGESERPGFWDRATDGLRAVVGEAREEARRRRKTYLGTEHLLLALSAREEDPASRALAVCGAGPAILRAAIDGRVGIPAGDPLPDETPFTRLALTSLRHALREALREGSESVGTGHLALGLLTLDDGLAHDVMVKLGVDYDSLRAAVITQA
ncbi:Clp protease N-terminal domain-containing protein [Actinomadura sp. DC4]|uniref:Clp protease N-terminal domain-containing protein n=1 Tax=Actinomadura sp. DC4 TaxID=3055069 RepID=UPI0025B0FFC7|nr:Clp protease N-terminal domain-containing protein [Actinomadura sp. DC4]MDN3351698.1 Clp protease N-terminal domain-containing protein [Actinomadura sp. DC4]